jgi:hypothetical protein
MANLPIEIIRYIFEYIDDIDIRRAFGLYGRINMSEYQLPIGCTKVHQNTPEKYFFHIPNLHAFEKRAEKRVIDDFVEVRISTVDELFPPFPTTILYYVAVYRFKPKSMKKNKYDLELFSSNIADYYWDFRIYSYIRK